MAYTTINKGSSYFNAVIYTGNGSTQSITGVGFQPDWTWIKERDDTPDHKLVDSVRGSTKPIESNTTEAEATLATGVTSFDSDGFSLGANGSTNGSADLFVSWNWLAGGTASANGNGSISSSVSANTTAGFSIVTYTGTGSNATVGHGLSSAPKFMIIKRTDSATNGDWNVYHDSLGSDGYIYLNLTDAKGTNTSVWQDTAPSSSVFSIGGGVGPNITSGATYVAYCFAEKKGFSKFGSYVGNSSVSDGSSIDGPFVYCGFKPAFIMAKASTRSENWYIFDNKRVGRNPDNEQLYADTNSTEGTTDYIDITSNGFRLIQKNFGLNKSGDTYIFWAFAEHPFVSSTGTPVTAR